MASENSYLEVSVRCARCQHILMDKEVGSNGRVRIKCPKCKHYTVINLALRRTRHPSNRCACAAFIR